MRRKAAAKKRSGDTAEREGSPALNFHQGAKHGVAGGHPFNRHHHHSFSASLSLFFRVSILLAFRKGGGGYLLIGQPYLSGGCNPNLSDAIHQQQSGANKIGRILHMMKPIILPQINIAFSALQISNHA